MTDIEQNSGIFKELTRRKVLRSAAAYVVIAWVIVQVASIVLPEFGAPRWAMRAVIIVLVAGFPPAMILAWSIDFSTAGFTRTAESGYSRARGYWPRIAIFLVASAISAAMLWLTWSDYIVQSERTLARPEIREQAVIAVNAPRKLAGRDESDWLGDGIANLIRSELADSRHAIILSQSRWQALIRDATSAEEIVTRANAVGIDYLIDGEYLDTPGGIVLTLHIEDVENGIEIQSARTKQADAAGILASIAELSIRIKQALRIPHVENVGIFEADFAVEHIDAYEAYIAGLAYYVDFDYDAAEAAFNAALEIAPDYHIARFRLAQVYESTGRSALAYENLGRIPLDASLSERERLYVEGAKAYFVENRNPKKAIEIYRKLVELYPYETEAGTLLAEAYWYDFQDDAAIREFRRLGELHPYDPLSWMALGERLLDVGDLEEAKKALEKYASMQSEDGYAFALLGNLASLQGDLETSIRHHEHALELKPGFPVARLGLARSRYLEGETELAENLWQLLMDDADVAAGYRIDAAFDLAGVLRGHGEFEASIRPINAVMPLIREEVLRVPLALATLCVTQLELGNTEQAATLISEAIGLGPEPVTRYLFVRGTLELRTGNLSALKHTVTEVDSIAGGSANSERTEAKAAGYLAGMLAFEEGDWGTAADRLSSAIELQGYQYAVYKLGLALLQQKEGNLDDALLLASEAATERDPGDLRLDLELDRARALILQAEILAEQGATDAARERARFFTDLWRNADPRAPELQQARAILGPGQ